MNKKLRNIMITIRLNPAERKALRDLAKRLGEAEAVIVRRLIRDAAANGAR